MIMENTDEPKIDPGKRFVPITRFGPLVLAIAAITAFFASGLHEYLNFSALQENYAALKAFVADRFVISLAVYILVYIAVTGLSLPGATVLSVLGGFLFGIGVGSVAVIVSATTGATIIFLIARTAIGDSLRRRARGFAARIEKNFSENAFSYLLLLRLIPLLPFVVVNIVPAMTGMKLRSYVLATFIGIIPGVFAFVSAGNGLGAVIATGGDIELSGLLMKPEIITPIIALSLLAFIPLIYKWARARRQKA